ncbi:MAG: hypothetical protein CL607_20685 [Anaerolineaceae bacterium]|nr:hypothetical protein [Anaerolineaceae bacterium]
MHKIVTVLLALLIVAVPIMAQDDSEDVPLTLPIEFDRLVEESISQRAFYDWWTIDLQENDEIRIEMTAHEGLVPLIGVLNEQRDLLARSDSDAQPEANGVAELTFTAEADGEYTIIATREGNDAGTSTGTYTLYVELLARIPARENDRIPVEFRCNDDIATTALFFQPIDEFNPLQEPLTGDPNARLRITAIGIGDFEPMILLQVTDREEDQSCIDVSPITAEGFAYQALGMRSDGDIPVDHIVQSSISMDELDWADYSLDVLIGSRDGQPGHFIVFVEGLAIGDRRDTDLIPIRRGPMARNTPISVYMIATSLRFDPVLQLSDSEETRRFDCDDAGLGDCADMPSGETLSFSMSYPDGVAETITGTRFDAGAMLFPDFLDVQELMLQSRSNSTHGTYALMFIGELPAP